MEPLRTQEPVAASIADAPPTSGAHVLPCAFPRVFGPGDASMSDAIHPSLAAAEEDIAAQSAAAKETCDDVPVGAGTTTANAAAAAVVKFSAGDEVVNVAKGDIAVYEGSYVFLRSLHEKYLLHIDDDPYSLESFFGQHLRMGGAYWTFTSLWLLGSSATCSHGCSRESFSTSSYVVTCSNAEGPAIFVSSTSTPHASPLRCHQSTASSLSNVGNSQSSSSSENSISVTRCSPGDRAGTAVADATSATTAIPVSDVRAADTAPLSSSSLPASGAETLSSAAFSPAYTSAPFTVWHSTVASPSVSLTALLGHSSTRAPDLGTTASSTEDGVNTGRTWNTVTSDGTVGFRKMCVTPCATREDHLTAWILSCQHSNGGFGQGPGQDPHITSTHYAVLLLLCMNRLHVLNREKVATWVHQLKVVGGGFKGDIWGECDTRYAYCGAACLTLLGHFDADTALQTAFYVQNCSNVDGGYAWVPGGESHAASAFCCIATLALCERLAVVEREKLASWLLERQLETGGFNGRPEKAPDVCYSFWILAALAIIGYMHWVDIDALTKFVLEAQDENGGIADRPGDQPDVFHTYFGIAALSLMHTVPGLKEVHPVFSIPCEVAYREKLGCCVLWG